MKKFATLALAGVMSMAMVGSAFAADVSGALDVGGAYECGGDTGVDMSWLTSADDNAVITITISADADHAGWGVAGMGLSGAAGDDAWYEPKTLNAKLSASEDGVTPVEVSFTVGELFTDAGVSKADATYFKVGTWNGGKIEGIKIGDAAGAGDTSTPVVYLAAAAALAGLALVVTRKKMA